MLTLESNSDLKRWEISFTLSLAESIYFLFIMIVAIVLIQGNNFTQFLNNSILLQFEMKTPLSLTLILVLIFYLGQTFNIRDNGQVMDWGEYNVSASRDYTVLAVASYCERKCLESWSCQITSNYLKDDKVTNVTFLMGTLTRAAGFVAYDHTKNQIIISLRGSSNPQNWISDFTFDTIAYSRCKDCKVHLGFLDDYKSIQMKLHQAMDELVQGYPNAQIVCTGHSMGAALSVIVGVEMKLKYNKVVEIHNVGCPRVGNVNFAQFVQTKVDRVLRVVHNRDLVVHLPPVEFGFHHPAHEIFWDEQMQNYTICNDSGEDKACSNKFSPHYSGADHSFYFWNLGKILKC